MKVFLTPVGLHSRAMIRIADALTRYAPPSVEIVNDASLADLHVLYVIGFDAWEDRAKPLIDQEKEYIVVQCCFRSVPGYTDPSQWNGLWDSDATRLVWSYYDLSEHCTKLNTPFYHAPLGVDGTFGYQKALHTTTQPLIPKLIFKDQSFPIITTGYVSAPCAEAIEEVWIAAQRLGLSVLHIGPPKVAGISGLYTNVRSIEGMSDSELAWYYSKARYVFSLRHTEGFELPAAEALVCGTRGVLFDQPDLHHWYSNHVEYVPDCSGEELIGYLMDIMRKHPRPINEKEHRQILNRFDWRTICKGFWEAAGV